MLKDLQADLTRAKASLAMTQNKVGMEFRGIGKEHKNMSNKIAFDSEGLKLSVANHRNKLRQDD